MTHALVLSSLLLFGASDDTVLFEDQFDTELQPGWKWIQEDAAEWRIRDGVLHMRSQPGGIWYRDDAKNILTVRPSKTDNVEARVQVAHKPKEKWEQAGLLWYVDGDHFVKLISEHIDGQMYVVLASEQGDKGVVHGKVKAPQATMQLRLLVESNRVFGLWRISESDKWSECGSCEFNEKEDPSFALYTQAGPSDKIRWVQFSSFVIKAAK